MRKLLTVMIVLTAFAGYAQKKKKGQDATPKQETVEVKPKEEVKPVTPQDTTRQMNPFIDHYLRKYRLATRWNDANSAKDALYDLIAETGNDSLAYSLALTYYESQQYASTVLITKDLMARNPKNVNLLQLSAAGFEGLGLRDKALGNFESVYLLTGNTAVLYKMTVLQLETKLYAECKANLDILLTKPDLDSIKVTANDVQKKPKEFPIKASIFNMKGMVAEHSGDKTLARKSYQDALAISPDFAEAKENLAKLK